MIKKTVRYIKPAEPTDHIISHVLTEIDGHSESMTIKDYHDVLMWILWTYVKVKA